MKVSLRIKLFLGFGAILSVVVIGAGLSYYGLNRVQLVQKRLIDTGTPSVQAGYQLQDGINRSLAALRGFMILGADARRAADFRAERQAAWQQIDEAMNRMQALSGAWMNPEDNQHLAHLAALIDEFRRAQQSVEDVSNSIDNIPAYKMLLTEAAPQAADVMQAITAIINAEAELAASPERKALLKLLADSRGSFAMGLANIRAYLLSGDEKFREEFSRRWKINSDRFAALANVAYLFQGAQRQQWNQYQSTRAKFAPLPEKMFAARQATDWNVANHLLGTEAAPRAQAIKDILANLRSSQEALAAEDAEMLTAKTVEFQTLLLLVALVSVVMCGVISFALGHTITSRLARIVRRATAIASGDLTGDDLHDHNHDDLAHLTHAMNQMSQSLRRLIKRVAESATGVLDSTEHVSRLSQQSANATQAQTQRVSEIASSVDRMSVTIQQIAENSSLLASNAVDGKKVAREGGDLVSQTVEDMAGISRSVKESAQSVDELGERGNQIGQVITIINEVAEQTNLLALNAAIEAARAGEAGRGFAVVAGEVRELASRTTNATEEVEQSIRAIQRETKQAVSKIQDGTERVAQGQQRVTLAGSALATIVDRTQEVATMVESIASASEQQSSAVNEIAKHVQEISTAAFETKTNALETSDAAEQMIERAKELQESVATFKL